jgi:hypothetical protein
MLFTIANRTVELTDIEPGIKSYAPTVYRFKLIANGDVHGLYVTDTCELAERIHYEVKSTLESLCVALNGAK